MPHSKRLTVNNVFDDLAGELGLTFVEGHKGKDRLLTRETQRAERPRLLGPLNFNTPNRIHLLGKAELRLFQSDAELAPDRFEYSFLEDTELIIISNGETPPLAITQLCNAQDIPLFVSTLPYSELYKLLRYRLTERLAMKEIIHGVMMDVHGTGVLITGEASVGKSELALELISRGHILVADDAPEFTRIAPGTLESRCPEILQDFLEVRGLGVLNIARMYGDAHTRKRKILRFIVSLKHAKLTDSHQLIDEVTDNRLDEPDNTRIILDVPVPERTIPVAPGRNLAVLVEAAVRDYILRSGGYSATRDLVTKQAKAMSLS